MAKKARPVGMPAAKTIVATINFAPRRKIQSGAKALAVGKAPATYKIIRTNQVDAKDAPVAKAAVAAIGMKAGPPSNNFAGTARKAAKLSISAARRKTFADVSALIATFPENGEMKKLKIKTAATSGRVAEEEGNAKVKAFLYAASREDDNDFHLIVGDDPASASPQLMTMELSGLPPGSSPHFARLNRARNSFNRFFGDNLPGESYDFYRPPVPVEVEGSLFWDASHAKGNSPGPQDLKPMMPVIWELHPISRIKFEP